MLCVLRLGRLLVVEAVDQPFAWVVEGDREERGASVDGRARNRARSPSRAGIAAYPEPSGHVVRASDRRAVESGLEQHDCGAFDRKPDRGHAESCLLYTSPS